MTEQNTYNHLLVEKKWQKYWEENKTFSVDNKKSEKTFYALDMFPFPSGAGLHVGHPEGYTATDIICRKKRMQGYKVLHPMGWDAFGLPAENFAIKTGVHPKISTNNNIENFQRQIKSLGFSYDWDREFATTDEDYYKFTQDLFLKLYDKNLLYEDDKPLNWCASCKVVCANEEVEQGLHERCGNVVTKKALKQWMFKITDYAERLLQDLDTPNVVLLHGWGGTGTMTWFNESRKYLEENKIEVLSPDFPNTENPVYSEWKETFEKEILPHLKSNSIILGHSLGCGFMQKYLTEENLKIGELIFVAPTVSDCDIPEIKNFFTEEFNYEKIKKSADNIFIIAGKKDEYITQEEFKFLENKLNAKLTVYKDRGHFGEGDSKNNEEVLSLFKNTVASLLDWPEKIKAMQRNWIGKSEGITIKYPTITQYEKTHIQKKRGTKGAHPRKENFSDSIRFSRIGNIIFSLLKDVKKKKYNNNISKIQESLKINNEVIIFDGFALLEHWKRKNNKEIQDRKENVITVLKALPNAYYESEEIAYFVSNNNIFRIIFEKIEDNKKRVKTYYKVHDLSEIYKKQKENNTLTINCYTTRPDTNFGATFVTLAPEHKLITENIESLPNAEEVKKYIIQASSKSDIERMTDNKEKTGVFTGLYVLHPANGKKLPLYVGDFVLAHVGTGAVVGVPGHDVRDFDFATAMGIDIIRVVTGKNGEIDEITEKSQVQDKSGTMVNSEFLNGLDIKEAKEKISEYYIKKNWATKEINYKLRDWIFTRQRYWGEPIPLVFDEKGKCFALDNSQLPLLLPESANYEPSATGESPLAKITDWVNVSGYITDNNKVIICEKSEVPKNKKYQKFTRETSTMPNWAGSSWYWLRYMDPKNANEAWSKDAEKQWGPVDLYVGGAEHAVLHLLYARFWHKAFYDLGLVSTKEPFKKLVNQGLILSYAYQRNTGGLVPVDEVEEKVVNKETGEKKYFEISTGGEVEKIIAKMSKSLKNVVNPDDIVNAYGADTLRMYEMFMGPFEQSKAWDTTALEGMNKFLMKIWRLFAEKEISESCPSKELIKLTHQTVKKVSHDIDEFKFNTAISQMMVWVNAFQKLNTVPKIAGGKFVRLLSPFAPHLAEELWQKFSPEDETISFKSWPSYQEELLVENDATYAVQVNGKLRGDFTISKEASKEECIETAKKIEKVHKFIQDGIDNGGKIRKEIFVPEKIVGFVVK